MGSPNPIDSHENELDSQQLSRYSKAVEELFSDDERELDAFDSDGIVESGFDPVKRSGSEGAEAGSKMDRVEGSGCFDV